MSNIYGGQSIPSWHQFDKIYNNYAEANNNASTDNVLLGRYVLIAYTTKPLSYSDRMVVLSTVYTKNNDDGEQENVSANISGELTDEQKIYQENLRLDGGVDYDRIVCQKVIDDGSFTYRPIANISETIDFANVDNNAFLQAFENIVKELEAAIENADSLLGTAVWTDF